MDECTPPNRLSKCQYEDCFDEKRGRGHERLLVSLKRRAKSLGLIFESTTQKSELIEAKESVIEIHKSTLPGQPTLEWIAENKINLSNGIEFMRIPTGEFILGSKREDEKPQHTLEIPYDYWMTRFPITNAVYNDFVIANGIIHPASIEKLIMVLRAAIKQRLLKVGIT